jgi:hypothetical protein
VDRDAFETEFARMSQANGIYLGGRRAKMMDVVFAREDDPDFLNIFAGSQRNEYLLVTGVSSYRLRIKIGGVRAQWIVDHDDLVGEAWHRRGTARGYVLDEVVLQHRGGTESFWMGFNDPRGPAGAAREIAKHNCETAARQINDACEEDAVPSGITFDPKGPEKAAGEARDAMQSGDYEAAFARSVVAVDRLHDFYVFEEFRNRQPTPADAWIVNGVCAALSAARASNSQVDISAGVRTATHRLRTISSAIERAGGNSALYRGALNDLAGCAPDVDVSDIYWS